MHSAGVATLALALTEGQCSQSVLAWALYHDVLEQYTGDIPATAKWGYQDLNKALARVEREISFQCPWEWPKLTEEEQALTKVCDMLDLCFKAVEELETGNTYFNALLSRGLTYLGGLRFADPYPWVIKLDNILKLLEKKQEQLNGSK